MIRWARRLALAVLAVDVGIAFAWRHEIRRHDAAHAEIERFCGRRP